MLRVLGASNHIKTTLLGLGLRLGLGTWLGFGLGPGLVLEFG